MGSSSGLCDANHPSAGQVNPASTTYAYDALDRLTAVTQPWGEAGGGDAITQYGYDVQDHLASVTDAEGTLTVLMTSSYQESPFCPLLSCSFKPMPSSQGNGDAKRPP